MRILGIDPGLATVGWGILDCAGSRYHAVDFGSVLTPAHTPIEDRLLMIWDDIGKIIDRYRPERLSIEELFFTNNITTGIPVAEARGVILTRAKEKGLTIHEYTPLQVKQAVVGYGKAEKKQVIAMVTAILGLDTPPKPDDTADALALAICDCHCGGSSLSKLEKLYGIR